MSTNAMIKVEGMDSNFGIYKHWDGYPEATLPWLEAFNKDFAEKRGDDPSYKAGQVLRSSVRDCKKFDLDDSNHTGWGVVIDADKYEFVEYIYMLNIDGTVKVTEA